MFEQKLKWEPALLQKYNISGPRYTSYPTALEFSEDYTEADYRQSLRMLEKDKSLSLYIHIPFCQNICYYCACNKIVTKDRSRAEKYIEYLLKEIDMVSSLLNGQKLRQIHWGGGTPTYLSMQQIDTIMRRIRERFDVPEEESTEISIEVDPRAVAIEDIGKLAQMGFNRMSFGVQDFDEKVQRSVNRIQPYEMTKNMVNEARRHGFKSINLDLIYGLPYQNRDSFRETLRKVITISPDRISVFNYAHLPHRFKPQRRIDGNLLPDPSEKLAIFGYIIDELTEAGYDYIGMDHFAKPDDELAIAQNNHCLHRNFQGYTTHEEYELIGVGVSSIGSLNGQYNQNVRDVESYYELIDQDKLPTWRGVGMTTDDRIRKSVIFELICHFRVRFADIEQKHNIQFKDYFKREFDLLTPFLKDRLIEMDDEEIRVTNRGRLLIRNICMTFDAYLNELAEIKGFSKVI